MSDSSEPQLRAHAVWDRPTRVLHWLDAALLVLTALLGLLFMERELVHIDGKAAKIALKQVHSLAGYGLSLTLAARLVWGFRGNRFVRWRAVLPTRGTLQQARAEAREMFGGKMRVHHLGHGPLGRLSSTALLGLATLVVGTGLIRASTDLFWLPFGDLLAHWAAAPGIDASLIDGMSPKEMFDPDRAHRILQLKLIAGPLHFYGAFALMGMVVLHVAGVALKEARQGGGLLSSMVTGDKVYPVDADVRDDSGAGAESREVSG